MRLILSLLLVIACASSYAQDSTLQKNKVRMRHVDGCYLDIKAGAGTGNMITTLQTSGEASYLGKLSATYMFTPHVGLDIGLQYEYYSYQTTVPASNYYYPVAESAYDTHLGYLAVPLSILYISNDKHMAGVYVSAGVVAAFLESTNASGSADGDFVKTQIGYELSAGLAVKDHKAKTLFLIGPFIRHNGSNAYSGSVDATGNLSMYGACISLLSK